jgi:erythrin-vacuolar iron transport family protein
MTVIGGVGHTLPFVIGEFQLAVIAAVLVVVIELGVISWVRHRDMDPAALGSAADRIG